MLQVCIDGSICEPCWNQQSHGDLRLPLAAGEHECILCRTNGESAWNGMLTAVEGVWGHVDVGVLFEKVASDPQSRSQFSFDGGQVKNRKILDFNLVVHNNAMRQQSLLLLLASHLRLLECSRRALFLRAMQQLCCGRSWGQGVMKSVPIIEKSAALTLARNSQTRDCVGLTLVDSQRFKVRK